MDTNALLLQIAIVFVAAKISSEISLRLGGAALVGELIAGAALGPHGLRVIQENQLLEGLAAFGVVVLLFNVGLETDFNELRSVGVRGIVVGSVGIILPFIGGAGLALLSGHVTITALFVGTALVATSVGITARVLEEKSLLRERESLIILAAAVVDDVLGLLVLAAVTSIGSGQLDPLRMLILFVETLVFVAIPLTVGRIGFRRHGHRARLLRIPHGGLSVALAVCFGFAVLAGIIGLAAIVGAYLAGLIVAELSDELELKRDMDPIRALLVPFFFVLTGARFDFSTMLQPESFAFGVVLTAIAIVTKLFGCGAAMWGTSLRSIVRVGVGMVPRGEVGLVVASLGLAAGVIDGMLYGAVLMMVAVTTLAAPVLLGPAYRFRAT
ncbi:MAG TPA: cation:proton antiporter [Candidatus Limnocylindria bacterium]|nr:cation:proton antiporter [Candidatus Limnocylindria bacterium]